MPTSYLLCVTAGSSVDQQSNNVTLFNLVEQINVPAGVPLPLEGAAPLEIHAYMVLEPAELNQPFEVRFVVVARDTGLETSSPTFLHRAVTTRYRSRTLGLPYPPVPGAYDLRLDWRFVGGPPSTTGTWVRDTLRWPFVIAEIDPRPPTRH